MIFTSRIKKLAAIMGLALLFGATTAIPAAQAHDGYRHDRGNHYGWRKHEYRRWHNPPVRYYRPGYVYAPPPVVYYPPPQPAGLNFIIPLHFD